MNFAEAETFDAAVHAALKTSTVEPNLSSIGRLVVESWDATKQPLKPLAERAAEFDWWQTDTATWEELHASRSEVAPQPCHGFSADQIKKASRKFVSKLIRLEPQRSDGKLNYYLGGSINTNLMAATERPEVTLYDRTALPELVPKGSFALTDSIKTALQATVRQIGDVDVFEHDWRNGPYLYNRPMFRQRLGYHELEEGVKPLFKRSVTGGAVIFDDLTRLASPFHNVASIDIDGEPVFVSHPVSLLASRLALARHLYDWPEDKQMAEYNTLKRNKWMADYRKLKAALKAK